MQKPVDSTWIQATVEFINSREEYVSSFVSDCVEMGAAGSTEYGNQPRAGTPGQEDCRTCGAFSQVHIYFPDWMGLERVLNMLDNMTKKAGGTAPGAGARLIECRRIDKQDWAANWRKNFPPERVSNRFWVVPPWEEVDLPEKGIPIIMEPGLAFGTGKHITTRFCLDFLEEVFRGKSVFPPWFLDIGCGSGILTIAGKRLGAQNVLGLDNDPDAILVARKNLGMNSLEGELDLVNGSLECCRGRFDLITANLTDKILVEYAESVLNLLAEEGFCILSGIQQDRAENILAAYQGLDLTGKKTDPEEGWVSLLYRKPRET